MLRKNCQNKKNIKTKRKQTSIKQQLKSSCKMIVWRNEIVVKHIIRIPISFLVGIFLGDSTVFIHLLLVFFFVCRS